MLGEIFNRLSMLLKELVRIEAISSGAAIAEKRENVSLKTIVEEACKRLFCKDLQTGDLPDLTLHTEREAMVIVVKNLLDNAIKYGKNPSVSLRDDALIISSEGDALPYPLEHYTEAFRQEYGEEKRDGFGLGLYIVHEILTRLEMQLTYRHEEGRNLFIISTLPLQR
jgi:two-component system OmpR family sensor kinase